MGYTCHEGGTLQGGHYTACVTEGTAWYKMDDHKVSTWTRQFVWKWSL